MITELKHDLRLNDDLLGVLLATPVATTYTQKFDNVTLTNVLYASETSRKHNLTKIYRTSVCKVHIPLLMSGIVKGVPAIKTVTLKGNNYVKNDPACKPQFKNIIKTQNYLTIMGESTDTGWINVPVNTSVVCHSDTYRLNDIKCKEKK